MSSIQPVPAKVRFAPSPTGALHLGGAMVAIANSLLARATGGSLILRIDDTDAARSTDENEAGLLRLLRWLEIDWDEGPIRQSERGDLYEAAINQLLADGRAYPCFCSVQRLEALRDEQARRGLPPRYDGRCRTLSPADAAAHVAAGAPHVVRLLVPDADVVVDDLLRGRITFPRDALSDPVLRRSDASAAYVLASVVDDVTLGVTHVVRGEDHLSNTAGQAVLFEALGRDVPRMLHIALLRDEHGAKLSKRAPLGTLDELVEERFLPTTVRRYLAELLGLGAIDPLDRDTPVDLARLIQHLPTGAPRVDRTRIESLGREDVARLSLEQLLAGIEHPPDEDVAPIVREMAADSPNLTALNGELRLLFDGPGRGDLPTILRTLMDGDDERLQTWDIALELSAEALRLTPREESPDARSWSELVITRIRAHGAALGARTMMQSLRVALSGRPHGPGLALVLAGVGPREALRRVHLARVVIAELREHGDVAVAQPGIDG